MAAPPEPSTRGAIARVYDEIATEYSRARTTPWPAVLEFIDTLPPRSRVLDAGCGHGRHAAPLLEGGHVVVGLDASMGLLDIARGALPSASFALGDVCRLPLRDRAFTAAIAAAVIHHLPSEGERLQALREIARVLAPRSRALVTVWAREQSRFDDVVEGPRGSGDVWVPWRAGGREVLRFYHLFVDNELSGLVLKAGLRVAKYFRSGDNYVAVAERHG